MFDLPKPVAFFLGANTPNGFVGYMQDVYRPEEDWMVYLLKSGPGTGKSTLLKSLYRRMTDMGVDVEAILCSSDPDSFDGVIIPQYKICVLDGTAPHVLEPRYWGGVETIVPLETCADTAALRRQAVGIIADTDRVAELHKRCRRFMSAVASLLSDSYRIALSCLDIPKAIKYAGKLAANEFGTRPNGRIGRESRRFLSAVTPQGLMVFHQTIQSLCSRIYVIEDEYGAASRILMYELRQAALATGHDIISCPCPLSPNEKLEHILVPDIGVGFTTSNPWHKVDFPAYRRIHATRFTDESALKEKKQLLNFNRRAARELLNEAVASLVEAKAQHDYLERYHIEAMDWKAVDVMSTQLIEEIAALVEQKRQAEQAET